QCTASAPRGWCFRGSIPSLCAPLSTLRRHPRGGRRMTRGQCGSLHLHWERLALSTPCRSPGARFVTVTSVGLEGEARSETSRCCDGALPLRCRFSSEDPQGRSGDEMT